MTTKEEKAIKAKIYAERMGINIACPVCKAPAGYGCLGEDHKPQSAWTHRARLGL